VALEIPKEIGSRIFYISIFDGRKEKREEEGEEEKEKENND
jgi:hypothetical protein